MQKTLFGVVTAPAAKQEPPKAKPKPAFPELSLAKGLNVQESTANAVFWHRILLNKMLRQQNSARFLHVLSNEIALKKGMKDAYGAVLDSLVRGS